MLRGTEHDCSYKEAKQTLRRRSHTPCASAARFDLIVQGFGRLRALGLRQTTGVGSPNARSLPPTSRSRPNVSHRPNIAVARESDMYLWAIVLAATSAGSCRLCWSASESAMPSELHSCRCAARRLARRVSQPRRRPYERANHLPACVIVSCGRVSVSLNRTRRVRSTGVGPSQRARVQHADALQPHRAHGALRPCWYSRR